MGSITLSSGRSPAAGRHLDSVILLNFFNFLNAFWSLPPTLGSVKFCIFHGDWRFHFFSNFIFLNLEYTWTFISTVGFLVHEILRSLKIPQDLLVLWNFFVPFFNAGWIWVCSTHHLPLRFGTQVPNMMCIMMVQKLKVA
jgi:hypothetical protein